MGVVSGILGNPGVSPKRRGSSLWCFLSVCTTTTNVAILKGVAIWEFTYNQGGEERRRRRRVVTDSGNVLANLRA